VNLQLKTADDEDGNSSSSASRIFLQSNSRLRRRKLFNDVAGVVIRIGGVLVLLSILAIFLVIFFESLPLFRRPEVALGRSSRLSIQGRPVRSDILADSQSALSLFSDGQLEIDSLSQADAPAAVSRVTGLNGATVTSASMSDTAAVFALGTSDGRVAVCKVPSSTGARTSPDPSEPMQIISFDAEQSRSVVQLALFTSPKQTIVAAILRPADDGNSEQLKIYSRKATKSLIGGSAGKETYGEITLPEGTAAASVQLLHDGQLLFAAMKQGQLLMYDLRKPETPKLLSSTASNIPQVTAADVLLGEQTIVVGGADGSISSWGFAGADAFGGALLQRFHLFQPHQAAITDIVHSQRNRTFAVIDEHGGISLNYATAGRTLLPTAAAGETNSSLAMAPKGDRLFAVSPAGDWRDWTVENPHPEASWKTLFGKVWYEGYSKPEYVWQSSSGSDEFEPKLSFIPLIYGTLKGTFFSLFFAVPLAILSAVYTAEFMSARLRSYVKPLIELMAALPSVVIGFIAGLWLAPALSPFMPGLILLPLCLIAFSMGGCLLWTHGPKALRRLCPRGSEVLLLIPVVLLATWSSFRLGAVVESRFLNGDYHQWLVDVFGITYDQRNALIVGVAMGFAVVPLIFTIAEDSLSAVPRHLRAASLALGANRWQTAARITLPAASPGIFSAIMLGFGRAIGETMIVLMATGNTPVMDPSPFDGFRALSANIAVELPEAAAGGTLYRVLFLASLLLFCVTFVINTFSEFVRQRLRKRYSQV
jgi:phosphate transport system permease protein